MEVTVDQFWDSEPPAVDRAEWRRIGESRRAASAAVASRSEFVADRLAALAEPRKPGERLGTKVALRALCGVSVGTFNEGVKLAQSRGYVTSRSGPGGGIFVADMSPIVRLGNSVLALGVDAASVADAVRMRDALDPLVIEEVMWHASAVDVQDMRVRLADMAAALDDDDAAAFVRANWALHARVAAVVRSALLRSVYLSLLEIVMSHALVTTTAGDGMLPRYLRVRHELAVRLVDAIEARDSAAATSLIIEHNELLKKLSTDSPPN